MSKNALTTARRQARTRRELKEVAYGRPRLSVFRSAKQIYVQVIDDEKGHTLAAASSIEKDIRKDLKTGADVDAAKTVGKIAAERALKAGVTKVVFDRG
jgi:large subunit ribosomal protein L18